MNSLAGKTVRFLCVNEEIKNGDLIRSICQDHEDGNGWDTAHQPYDHALWQPVENIIPYWIGKTLEMYYAGIFYGPICDEIIRIVKD